MSRTILVTGGAGFIGSALVRHLVGETDARVVNVDKLTYAGNLESVAPVEDSDRYRFRRTDVCEAAPVRRIFREASPDAVVHLAAESHVDRSIDGPRACVRTNVFGTYTMLEAAREHWQDLPAERRDDFRFLHVSTDEVYGSLGREGAFTEESPYAPRSPYSASKAAADHLARAWGETYGLPVIVTNSGNNFGPYQHPEKLLPVVILNALQGQPIPVYGTGENVRDWLYVEDHVRALLAALDRGRPGEAYNIGARNEMANIDLVRRVCDVLDEVSDDPPSGGHASLITFVEDRPGHDFRYAIDPTKTESELGWRPAEDFNAALRRTVRWYVAHRDWCRRATGQEAPPGRQGLAVEATWR